MSAWTRQLLRKHEGTYTLAQRLEESSRWSVEVVTTIVAFVMGGYAYGALFVVLHRQLGGDIDKLLRTAGVLIGLCTSSRLPKATTGANVDRQSFST